MRPKKRFGQHFLINRHACRRIVDSLELTAEDTVLEIGPGRGALTGLLVESARRVVAVEAERECAAYLEKAFAGKKNIEIIQKDFLLVNVQEIVAAGAWKAVGNLPYNVASPILFHILPHLARFGRAVFMFQYEVAKRITAGAGTGDYSFLSVAAQFFAQPKIIFHLKPGSFYPAPNVDSSVVAFIARTDRPAFIMERAKPFLSWVDGFFRQRRKALLGRIGGPERRTETGEIFELLGIEQNARPEDVTVEQWIKLFSRLPSFL